MSNAEQVAALSQLHRGIDSDSPAHFFDVELLIRIAEKKINRVQRTLGKMFAYHSRISLVFSSDEVYLKNVYVMHEKLLAELAADLDFLDDTAQYIPPMEHRCSKCSKENTGHSSIKRVELLIAYYERMLDLEEEISYTLSFCKFQIRTLCGYYDCMAYESNRLWMEIAHIIRYIQKNRHNFDKSLDELGSFCYDKLFAENKAIKYSLEDLESEFDRLAKNFAESYRLLSPVITLIKAYYTDWESSGREVYGPHAAEISKAFELCEIESNIEKWLSDCYNRFEQLKSRVTHNF